MVLAARAVALAVLGALTVAPAAAQEAASYPSRAIHIVVPFPAGGPADIAARLIGQKMSEDWGAPVVVDNRPGANTIIGAQVAARAAPDGYTLLMVIDSTLTMNQYLYRTLPYDPLADFAPITPTVKSMSLLAVPAATGPRTVSELMGRAKASPGKLNYGSGTITAQLMGALFHKAAGLDILDVPFKGTAETVQGLLTGSVDLIYAATVVVGPMIESGQIRPLAKLDSRRTPYPELPTLAAASDLRDLDDVSVWLGLVAPKGTPKLLIDKINREVVRILADPGVRQKFDQSGNFAVSSTPEEFEAFIPRKPTAGPRSWPTSTSNTIEASTIRISLQRRGLPNPTRGRARHQLDEAARLIGRRALGQHGGLVGGVFLQRRRHRSDQSHARRQLHKVEQRELHLALGHHGKAVGEIGGARLALDGLEHAGVGQNLHRDHAALIGRRRIAMDDRARRQQRFLERLGGRYVGQRGAFAHHDPDADARQRRARARLQRAGLVQRRHGGDRADHHVVTGTRELLADFGWRHDSEQHRTPGRRGEVRRQRLGGDLDRADAEHTQLGCLRHAGGHEREAAEECRADAAHPVLPF
jgi:tripartite-type tricarboxylate transporter receptor subunit TctC